MLITPRPDNHIRHVLDVSKLSQRQRYTYRMLESVIAAYAPQPQQTKSEQANFAETLPRALKAWGEVYDLANADLPQEDFDQILSDQVDDLVSNITSKASVIPRLTEILETGFPLESNTGDCGIITQGPVQARGLCPHHLLPVNYEIYVCYKPVQQGTVLGLSKLSRISSLLASRPVLQEQVSADIADALFYDAEHPSDLPQILSAGSAVQVLGEHQCMSCRGVHSNALTLTTTLRGLFAHDSAKSEFYQAIESIRHSNLKRDLDVEEQEARDEEADEEMLARFVGGDDDSDEDDEDEDTPR